MRALHFTPQPPDPVQAVESCQQYLERCVRLLESAQTHEAQQLAQFWIDNAERQLTRWQAALERQGVTQ